MFGDRGVRDRDSLSREEKKTDESVWPSGISGSEVRSSFLMSLADSIYQMFPPEEYYGYVIICLYTHQKKKLLAYST